jgi:AAA family ATP:ADP antiporter
VQTDDSSPRRAGLTGLAARLILLKPGEGPVLLVSTLYFFLLLLSYYLLRPLREAFGIARGADSLPWLMTGTMAAMLVASPAFAALAARLPRRRMIPAAYRFFAANIVLFAVALVLTPAERGPWLGYVFYVWLSVFNLFVVSVFWALMADGFSEDQGQRLFGVIAVGGTLGAIGGAWLAAALSAAFHARGLSIQVTAPVLLLLSAVFLEGAAQCVRFLSDRFGLGWQAGGPREPGPSPMEGLRRLGSSPYLRLIATYLLLFTVTSTFLYLEQGRIVAKTFTSGPARTAAFARLDLWTNLLTLAAQLFFTGRLIRLAGIPFVLLMLPLLTFAGFGALAAWPAFATLAVVQVARRGLHYAVDRPAREILYIPLGPEEKYKTKPFIDTFIYRGGDLLGVWTPSFLAFLGTPAAPVALGVSALWLGSGAWLGRQVRKVMGGTG